MPAQSYTFPYVRNARPAEISDHLLDQLTRVANDLCHDNATQAEAEWLASAMPTLLAELKARRAAMAGQPLPPADNVVQIAVR